MKTMEDAAAVIGVPDLRQRYGGIWDDMANNPFILRVLLCMATQGDLHPSQRLMNVLFWGIVIGIEMEKQ